MTDLPQWLDLLLGPLGLLVGAILAVVGVIRGWWVPGSWHRKTEAERDRWMDMALGMLGPLDRAVTNLDPPPGTPGTRR